MSHYWRSTRKSAKNTKSNNNNTNKNICYPLKPNSHHAPTFSSWDSSSWRTRARTRTCSLWLARPGGSSPPRTSRVLRPSAGTSGRRPMKLSRNSKSNIKFLRRGLSSHKTSMSDMPCWRPMRMSIRLMIEFSSLREKTNCLRSSMNFLLKREKNMKLRHLKSITKIRKIMNNFWKGGH